MNRSAPPLIDVDVFNSTAWHDALHSACRDWGCFQLRNHGIDAALLESALIQQRAFFGLTSSEKRAIERSDTNVWGYFDRELTRNVRDWKEILDIGPPARTGPLAGSRPQWPGSLPEFRAIMESLMKALENVANQILAGISQNLGMPADFLADGFAGDHTSFLRLNYYPPCEEPDLHLGISPHSDAGALTVLVHDGNPGLQFRHEGQWHSLDAEMGSLIINIGDIVQVWSNDLYRAPLHRVLAGAQDRCSAPYFYNPRYDTNYAPLPGALGEDAPHYRPINWGEFRAGRAAGDYADLGEEIQISHFRV